MGSDQRRNVVAMELAVDDPGRADIEALLAIHVAFAFTVTPQAHAHAMSGEKLRADDRITVFSARDDGELCGIGALKELDASTAEIKSMHVTEARRGQGVGSTMVEHLIGVARRRGYTSLVLETGSFAAFDAARLLYERHGFMSCEPFDDYEATEYNMFMRLELA